MVEIVQISDIHYGSGDFHEEWLKNAISYINDKKPDYVICTGDLTCKGRLSEFQGVSRLLKKIEVPLLCVPGNHDAKNNGLLFFEQYIGLRRSKLVLDDKDTLILGLRSPKHDIREGEIGDEQIEWMINTLEEHPKENRIFALHHHLIAVPDAGQKRDLVSDAGDILAITQEYQVDLVLSGHRHVPHAWVIGPTTFLYCGTTSSEKLRADEAPCFNHIILDGPNLEVYLINSTDLEKKQLLIRKEGQTEFIRPRKVRIDHLRKSKVFKVDNWTFAPKHSSES